MTELVAKQKIKVVLIVMLAIVFTLLVVLLTQTIKLQKLTAIKKSLDNNSRTLAQNEEQVDKETTYRESDEFLEDYARQELDMGGEEDYIVE